MFQNIHFVEQSNFVTDLILSVILFILSALLNQTLEKTPYQQIWRQYFILMGCATLVGGFGHLLSFHTGTSILLVSWLLVILATYFLEKNMVQLIYNQPIINAMLFIKAIAFSVWLLYVQTFLPVTISLIIGMVGIVCSVLYFQYVKTTEVANIIIISAILSSSLAGMVRVMHIDLATWFNANDLAHMISACSFWGLYMGVKRMA